MSEEEATEKGVILVTPGSSKPNNVARRNSTGKTDTRVSPSLPNSDGIPHYLRASTGSCHDFCKYGRKHVFEAKKRRPVLPKFLGNSETTKEEHNHAGVSALRERRKKPELKLKQPITDGRNGPKVIKQKGLSPAPDTPSTQADGSSEELFASVEHTPANQPEGTWEEPESIKLMIPSPYVASDEHGPASQAELSEEITMQLDTPSPTYRSDVSADRAPLTWASAEYTPLNLAEISFEEPVTMELEQMTSSPIQESIGSVEHTLANQAERSPKKPLSVKLTTSSSIQENITSVEHNSADRAQGSSEGSIRIKPMNSIQKSIVSAKHPPVNCAERLPGESARTKLKSPSLVKKSILSAEGAPANRLEESSEEQDQANTFGLGDRKKKQVTQLKTAPQLKTESSDRPKIIKQKKFDVSGESNIIKQKSSQPIRKIITSVEPGLLKQKNLSSVKKSIASGTPNIMKQKAQKVSSPHKGISVSSNSVLTLKSKVAVVKSTSPLISSGALTILRNQENRKIRSARLSESGEKKILKPPQASLSPQPVNRVSSIKLRKYKNTKSASPLKYQAKAENREHDNEFVEEKTLYVIEPRQENKDLKPTRQKSKIYRSSLSSHFVSSSSPSSPSVYSHGKGKHVDSDSASIEAGRSNWWSKGRRSMKLAVVLKGDNKQRPRRTATVLSEEKPPTPHKLKFRRGKVINIQSDNNGPRRLRFRPVRVVSESQNDVVRMSFRKRRELNVADSSAPSAEAPAVVLRHQDVQDKKDTQGLFNLVIEETASKLVETRKSKVKALVGAFETVISLQESKVAPTV